MKTKARQATTGRQRSKAARPATDPTAFYRRSLVLLRRFIDDAADMEGADDCPTNLKFAWADVLQVAEERFRDVAVELARLYDGNPEGEWAAE